MVKENTSVANIHTDFKGVLFRWIRFTYPFHKLTPQEQELLSLLLYYYFELKKNVTNEDMLWKLVFDYGTKVKIKTELAWKDYTLQNALTRLRKKGIITKNNQVARPYVPNIKPDAGSFKLIFNFHIDV